MGSLEGFKLWLDDLEQSHVYQNCDEAVLEEMVEELHPGVWRDIESVVRGVREYGGKALDLSAMKRPVVLRKEGLNELVRERYYERGAALIRAGKVACVTVAGGDATRLGWTGPKGKFPVMPITGGSLFECLAEKIKQAEQGYEVGIPWVVMTSPYNDQETREYFEQNGNFGLSEVRFMVQGVVPSLDEAGNLAQYEDGRLVVNPDGHGGFFYALGRSGHLTRFQERGIAYLSYFQVDNPLVNVLDEVFLGFHDDQGGDFSTKSSPKAFPEERVGVLVDLGGKLSIVEYSDMPEELAAETDDKGQLKYDASNLAIHLINIDHVSKVVSRSGGLPWHFSKKKLKNGEMGCKPERFIFDALESAECGLIMEVGREEEFSPVKNKEGKDSVTTCREALHERWCRWLIAAGRSVEHLSVGDVEIRDSFAESAQVFLSRKGDLPVEIKAGTVLK